jgi:protein-S-isoprenylcysteine O-methyltransferase Ste14
VTNAEAHRDTVIAWTFVAIQLALLAIILVVPSGDDWAVPAWMSSAARLLQWCGLAVLAVGLVNLGRSLTALPTPVEHGRLKTQGLYRLARHPIYSGIMALTLGSAMRSGNVVSAAATVALIGWFMLKARWEEGQLMDRYPGYRTYAARTPRFVPGWPFGADRETDRPRFR